MNANTIRRNAVTYVLPVVVTTIVGALVLAYGPVVFGFAAELVQGVWDGVVSTLVGLAGHVEHFFGVGQQRPVSGLGCWDEVKASLPVEHLCGDVGRAAVGSVNFTGYPRS